MARPLSLVAAIAVALLAGCGSSHPRRRAAAGPPAATATSQPAGMPGPRPAAMTIGGLVADLRALERIARANGGTRAAGTSGDRASVAYVTRRLRDAGYRVTAQPVPFSFFEERRPPRVALRGTPLAARTMIYSGSGTVRGRVRALPLRLGEPSDIGCARRDFASLRQGEIAVVQRGSCLLRDKVRNADAAGAVAVLVVNDGRPGSTGAFTGTLGAPGARIPALGVSTGVGRRLARAAGGLVSVSVDAVSERRTTSNVIAEPTGAPRRLVMAGAHLDSVPAGPGINDDGSGVATLLAVADRFRARPPVRFALWGAEELGLVGSRRYVRSLGRTERRRIAAYLNLDMVGSPNAVPSVYGNDAALERIVRRAARAEGLRAQPTSIGGASDHASFAAAGIDVAGLFTGAEETKTAAQARRVGGRAGRPADPCYHRSCDTLSNVDRDVLVRAARATAAALQTLAHARANG
jgi:Zn-dependent M28 family amino/carboxypeptidase